MRDYVEQVKELRDFAEEFDLEDHTETAIMLANASDAIEELLITTSAQKETIEELRARNSAQADMLDGEWISVEERLPRKYEEIITVDKHGRVQWNYLINEKHLTWSTGYHITHWMPLPAAPKED